MYQKNRVLSSYRERLVRLMSLRLAASFILAISCCGNPANLCTMLIYLFIGKDINKIRKRLILALEHKNVLGNLLLLRRCSLFIIHLIFITAASLGINEAKPLQISCKNCKTEQQEY